MKHLQNFLILVLVLIIVSTEAQTNINPDPNGDPWWAGGAIPLPPEEAALIPELTLSPESLLSPLPSAVNNSDYPYFPDILNQDGQSCIQVAEVSYMFTYEMNRVRGVEAGDWNHQNNNMGNLYHYLFTYNFLNKGSGSTLTQSTSGLRIIKELGCPMYSTYYDPILTTPGVDIFKYWMSGYDKYLEGIGNKVDKDKPGQHLGIEYVLFNENYESLDKLKHWLSDHGTGAENGGLAVILVYMDWIDTYLLPVSSPHANEKLITQMGPNTSGQHAFTIVGYDDNVCYDFNGDGQYSSSNNLLEREYGAFLIANSSGVGFGNNGFVWLPYRMMPGQLVDGANSSYICHVTDDTKPRLTLKAQIEYPHRDSIKISAGYATDANQQNYTGIKNFRAFTNNGGPYSMKGLFTGPIELGLDYSCFFENNDVGKVFLIIEEGDFYSQFTGEIESFSLIDYRWNEEFELPCDQANVTLLNNQETILSIDYDLIPHEAPITQDLSLFSNMVSRFSPNIDNNSTLTIEQGVRIDMYNSDINIRSGSSLVIEDGVTFLAKRGQSKITVSGDIEIGDNVRFIAEDGAELELVLSSPYVQADIHRAEFDKASLVNYGMVLNIDSCTFNESGCLYSYDGDITVDQSTFTDTWLYIEDRGTCPDATFSMTNCTVNNPNVFVGANILNYGKFFIINNNITATDDGLRLYNCGSSNTGNQNIFNNTISNCGGSGIMAYNVTASVANNHISGNDYGIRLLNGCNVALFGDISAQTHGATQEVMENDSYEIYISRYSFPWYFRYNYISDSSNLGNPTDPMVYYSVTSGGDMSQKDVRYNCWGNDFSASEDLYPPSYFDYTPTWCPGGSGSQTPTAEQMYSDGQDQFAAQQYFDSKATYTSLIDTYPKTVYAASAMKELTVLERFAGDDYSSLQNYFATNDSIQTDTTLRKLALKLCNVCDIKQENWPSAIDYFENIISNPETLEDSVFAQGKRIIN